MSAKSLSLALALGLLVSGSALFADEDEHRWFGFLRGHDGVAPVDNALYAKECGACHFAYPPGLLPARSWARLMDGLADHFGDNAELDPASARSIRDYLIGHAADRAGYRRSQKIAQSVQADAPLRITEVPYIRRKHREIPDRYISGNPKVRSLSNCGACHVRAAQGDFEDEGVRIPGFSRWEDDD